MSVDHPVVPFAERSTTKPVSSDELSTHAKLMADAEAGVAVSELGAIGPEVLVVAFALLEGLEDPPAFVASTR